MQRIRPIIQLSVLVALCLCAGVASATDPCPREARHDFGDCKRTCREDSQVAKDACLKRDHACVEVCRAERGECHDAAAPDGAFDLCEDQLQAARQECRTGTLPDTPERDTCIDQAQVASFKCRDDARELAKPLLKDCRADFRLCVNADECKLPDPAEAVDVSQCRSEAGQLFAACQVTCVEDYQVAKDVCKNRDHDCVEGCRADRHTCKTPILDALELARDGCKQTRDAAVANCQLAHPTDPGGLDSCIDDAQVAAFQCRDAAREVARPQLEVCRQNFGECARMCPAPAP
jgi:hypothetical protein